MQSSSDLILSSVSSNSPEGNLPQGLAPVWLSVTPQQPETLVPVGTGGGDTASSAGLIIATMLTATSSSRSGGAAAVAHLLLVQPPMSLQRSLRPPRDAQTRVTRHSAQLRAARRTS
jgi:hypothetical protein